MMWPPVSLGESRRYVMRFILPNKTREKSLGNRGINGQGGLSRNADPPFVTLNGLRAVQLNSDETRASVVRCGKIGGGGA